MKHACAIAGLVFATPFTVHAQPAPITITLPVNTLVEVTPADEITSKQMKEGTTRPFLTVNDVSYQGAVIIPRGSPVTAEVTWRTGKGIVGKSAKFELSFRSVRVDGREKLLRGTHRQEGRGNTAGALLGSMIITGRSATMSPGQIVNVFTAEPLSVQVVPAAFAPTVQYVPVAPAAAPAQQAPAGLKSSRVRCVTCQ